MSQTEIPISGGTLDDLDLERLIDFDLCCSGTPFPSPDHAPRTSLQSVDYPSSIALCRNFNDFGQSGSPWQPSFVSTGTWPQFQVITNFVESVNGTASQNHPPKQSSDSEKVLNEVQTSDQYSGVPQNVPGLVNEEAIEANLKMVHYKPVTDNASSRVRESRKKKNAARITKVKLGLDQVNLSPFP